MGWGQIETVSFPRKQKLMDGRTCVPQSLTYFQGLPLWFRGWDVPKSRKPTQQLALTWSEINHTRKGTELRHIMLLNTNGKSNLIFRFVRDLTKKRNHLKSKVNLISSFQPFIGNTCNIMSWIFIIMIMYPVSQKSLYLFCNLIFVGG